MRVPTHPTYLAPLDEGQSHVTTSPETKTMTEEAKATYEARYCPGMPTDCCDYGVISHETGKEVCRVWDRDDAERITSLLNTRQPSVSEDHGKCSECGKTGSLAVISNAFSLCGACALGPIDAPTPARATVASSATSLSG